MRMLVAVLVMFDLISRSFCLKEHYTDIGVLSRELLFENWKWVSYVSFHTLSGGLTYQILLFIGAFLLAIFLFLGYKTRVVSILSWLFLLSLHHRNPLILYGGDDMLILTLFLGMFLPWGRIWSWDSRAKNAIANFQYFDISSVAFILQFCCLFWFASVHKIMSGWFESYDVLYYVVASNTFVTPLIDWLRMMPFDFFTISAIVIVFVDLISPFLLFIPFKNDVIRKWIVLEFIIKHLIMNLFLFLGIFSFSVVFFLVGLFPSIVWGKGVGKKLSRFFDAMFSPRRELKLQVEAKCFDWFKKGALSFFILGVFWSNLNCSQLVATKMPRVMRGLVYVLNIDQNWYMFTEVPHFEYWPVFVGELESGKKINLLDIDKDISEESPKYLAMEINPDRRFSFFFALESDYYLKPFCNYIISEWNASHNGSEKIKRVTFKVFNRQILPGYKYGPGEYVLGGEYMP